MHYRLFPISTPVQSGRGCCDGLTQDRPCYRPNATLRPGQLPESSVLCHRDLEISEVRTLLTYVGVVPWFLVPPAVVPHRHWVPFSSNLHVAAHGGQTSKASSMMMTHDDWTPQVGPRKYHFLEPLRPKLTSHHRTMA
ncbi:hypothetical protein ASPBRDRAFT_647108 [Aspergillus brasiliensis CBS 101740]|uniref:Uncharacterized protein n=1 Tax=Aspergillus brasiliensis (strain CBS 101740 / IMI 381727 / IBT 21946) TaxID=767769 RepID=A0A1L9UE64_ASPBC|nr:hypothetical protein ASPBRDRAFT_647108 [Aspergillus brasiliensis CBS 101740]